VIREHEQEIAANLERAEQSIQAAKEVVVKGYIAVQINRGKEPANICSGYFGRGMVKE